MSLVTSGTTSKVGRMVGPLVTSSVAGLLGMKCQLFFSFHSAQSVLLLNDCFLSLVVQEREEVLSIFGSQLLPDQEALAAKLSSF